MNIMTVGLLAGGIVLIYAGIKGYDPRDVVRDAIKGKTDPGGDREDWIHQGPQDNPLIPGLDELYEQSRSVPEEGTGSAQV